MMDDLTQLQYAAALAEMVYRRSQDDQRLDITQTGGTIPGEDVSLTDANKQPLFPPSLTLDPGTGYYYDDSTGFVGRVVRNPDGTIYVVFRGTDSGLTDFAQANFPLGFGTFGPTQLDDAIALTKAAIAANGGNTA
jgi:hypothetical protein